MRMLSQYPRPTRPEELTIPEMCLYVAAQSDQFQGLINQLKRDRREKLRAIKSLRQLDDQLNNQP